MTVLGNRGVTVEMAATRGAPPAPCRRKRSQSGSSGRSPPTGAKKPLGVVSAPTTSATSHSPARIWARAAFRAVAPDAQAAYELATRAPDQPRPWANVAPATKPG